VILVELDGEARIYPIQVLIWHEIVNDTVGETPVAVTFCPLCSTALVFERIPSENAYSLQCPRGCGDRMLLEETMLLNSIQHLLPGAD